MTDKKKRKDTTAFGDGFRVKEEPKEPRPANPTPAEMAKPKNEITDLISLISRGVKIETETIVLKLTGRPLSKGEIQKIVEKLKDHKYEGLKFCSFGPGNTIYFRR